MSSPKKKNAHEHEGRCFVTWFRHWRSGRIIRASDYGLKCFPVRGKRNK